VPKDEYRDESQRLQRNKKESVEAVSSGRKTAATMARLFKIHPATVSRLIAQLEPESDLFVNCCRTLTMTRYTK
jgi:hypothetical protein